MAKKRPYDLTNIVESAITGTHRIVLDKSTSLEALSTELNNLLPGLISFVEIGSWNMQNSYYKEVEGVEAGLVPITTVIQDDNGKFYCNGIFDLEVFGTTAIKTVLRDPYNQALYCGQRPIINIMAFNQIISSNPGLLLMHNCPSLLHGQTKDFTLVAMDFKTGTTAGYDNDTIIFDGSVVSSDIINSAKRLRVGDVISTTSSGVLYEQSVIKSIDLYRYTDIGQQYDIVYVRLNKSVQAENQTVTGSLIYVKRPCDEGGGSFAQTSNYEGQIRQIADVSGGVNTEQMGTFTPHSPNVLTNFKDTNIMRGYVVCVKVF